MSIRNIDFTPELTFKTSRSSGKGGQHVNKVSTRVALYFDIMGSGLLSERQKARLARKLKNRISKEGVLHLVVDEERSQYRNRKIALERFYELLEKALRPEKKRIPTKPSASAKRKRLRKKKELSEKKQRRRENNR